MIDANTYTKRREALRARLATLGIDAGAALFPGNREAPRNYVANPYSFRQDSTFLYFFGMKRPDLAATIDLASGAATVYGNDADIDDIVWTGPLPSIADDAALAGVRSTKPRAALASDLSKAARILYLPPYRADTLAELAELTGKDAGTAKAGASVELIKAVVAIREIKDDDEIAELERAATITVKMHRAALAEARPGMTESEVAAIVAREALAGGGDLSFPVIATTKGATLHNHDRSKTLREGGLFLLDCGAETANGYAGDLTTTFPVGKRFDARQREIYDIVLAACGAACDAAKPGRPHLDAHLAASKAIASGLSALGIMRGNVDEAVATGAHALFFPHGVGHQIGLDVHDMEALGESHAGWDGAARPTQFGLSALRLGKILKPGMVHSVEPGIYFIPELIARWKSERKLETFIDYAKIDAYASVGGVRNEYDRLVTKDGGRLLGPSFDKTAAAIESARA